MGAIYILWLRELKRYVRSRVQIVVSLGQPCLYLLALGFGLGPVFKQAGHGSYLQFMAPGVVGMTVLFQFRVLRHCHALGSAIRLPEGNAGRARIAHADHDWPHVGRRDRRRHPGHAHPDHLPHRRLPSSQLVRYPGRHFCSW